jgi:glutaminase
MNTATKFLRAIATGTVACWLLAGCCASSKSKAAGAPPSASASEPVVETVSPPPQPTTSVPSAPPTTIVATPSVPPTTWTESSGTTGMPSAETLQRVVNEAHARFKSDTSGKNADYIPYLASVPSNLFGVAIVTADGRVFTAGDVDYSFSIQSCSKVFTLAQIMQESGQEAVFKKIGVEPTGMPFNSVTALGLHDNRAINPLVNAGAMASVSMVKANSAAERWDKILAFQSKFAGEQLKLIDDVYKSEAETNWRNRGIAHILYNNQNLFADPLEACDVYTRQCSIGVTAKQLAVMGATLANSGVNPITRERCIEARHVPRVLAVMTIAGFYDESGQWAYTAGLPAKTGVGGGIVAVVPGRMSIVGFSPPVNEAGNSVRATKAINYINDQLNLNLFGSTR